MADLTPTKIDLEYAESKIIFLICDCSLHKDYSFWKLTREQATKFIDRLKHVEKLTWSEFSSAPREKALTPEKSGTKSFNMIDEQNTAPERFAEKHYFHFRVPIGIFRIFGYQKKQYFCITHIDRDGRVHH